MQGLINYPHIASMAFNTPLYATPELIAGVKSVLIPRLTGGQAETVSLEAASEDATPLMMTEQEDREIRRMTISGNIAVINVHGVLVSRRGTIDQSCSELISYERLRTQISAALNHDMVQEIVLDFHSGGGMAMGCKELADFIHAATEIKPITAIVNFAAYSAAYFLAAACSKVICSPTGGVGSIGVILETFEVSKWEEEVGITYNTFYRGGHKNDMSPHEPITEQAVAEINQKLDKSYQIFTESVAQYREIDPQLVVDTEARLFDPEEALSLGLIDEISPAQDAVNQIAQSYVQQETRPSIGLRAAAINLESQL
ncbi:S49 family peptidase [Neptuniibacter sp.]|uniref:S49 family peptidase n=1 Tax=Neptuniibacter sp. TaxID=1962643 RepID=UPI00260CD5B6|nr:S49 family peptidase [Neptuniibacter sp.]MCP4595752.1 S49 family peptidase [Neptuniibacter sp.]